MNELPLAVVLEGLSGVVLGLTGADGGPDRGAGRAAAGRWLAPRLGGPWLQRLFAVAGLMGAVAIMARSQFSA